jgi:hypothetical protein
MIVQRYLARLHFADHCAYCCLIHEINGWLRLVLALARFSTPFPSITMLGDVLGRLRSSRGSNVDFARCSDREAIGNAFIVSARGA